jgi:hypothetical protein
VLLFLQGAGVGEVVDAGAEEGLDRGAEVEGDGLGGQGAHAGGGGAGRGVAAGGFFRERGAVWDGGEQAGVERAEARVETEGVLVRWRRS